MAQFHANKFSIRGHSLYYEEYGEGSQCIVLIHGILMDSMMNRPIARLLAQKGYRVILVDMLGHGQSDKPRDITFLRMDHYADHVVMLLDYLKIDAALIGGASLGAGVSLQAAIRHPERVRGLLLEMPVLEHAAVGVTLVLAPIMLGTLFGGKLVGAATKLLGKLPKPKNETITSLMNGLSHSPEAISAVLSGVLVGPVAPSIDARKKIRVPTAIISHMGDALHPFADGERLSKQIPGAEFIKAKSPLELRNKPERIINMAMPTIKKAWQPSLRIAS